MICTQDYKSILKSNITTAHASKIKSEGEQRMKICMGLDTLCLKNTQ